MFINKKEGYNKMTISLIHLYIKKLNDTQQSNMLRGCTITSHLGSADVYSDDFLKFSGVLHWVLFSSYTKEKGKERRSTGPQVMMSLLSVCWPISTACSYGSMHKN